MRIPQGRCPTHPGIYIKEDILEEMDMTQQELADRLFVSRRTVNQIVNFKRSITPEMAMRLGILTATTPEMWMGLQTAFDMWEARQGIVKTDIVKIKPFLAEA
ncbi:MAG: HigA family addiction module antidote protein [SAR324 cluster bacterium]|nr:HigA family addiction module antidote protein [SAR324 cluster bacterium]